MADTLTKKQRSYCMSRIRSRNTKPELKYKERVAGFIHQHKAFGNPDFINFRKKTAFFIDGCFWHRCPKHYIQPKSNKSYWIPKLNRNQTRDMEVNIAYKKSGWKVMRIWEHELK